MPNVYRSSYATNFPQAEDPLSEGVWTSRGMRCTVGFAYGVGNAYALYRDNWLPNQRIDARLVCTRQRYTVIEELVLILRTGYVFYFANRHSDTAYVRLEKAGRVVASVSGERCVLASDDNIAVQIDGENTATLSACINGVEVLRFDDATPLNGGVPGIGWKGDADSGNGFGFSTVSIVAE